VKNVKNSQKKGDKNKEDFSKILKPNSDFLNKTSKNYFQNIVNNSTFPNSYSLQKTKNYNKFKRNKQEYIEETGFFEENSGF